MDSCIALMNVCHSVTLLAQNHYYPGFSPAAIITLEHYKESFPAGYPFNIHLGRERQLWTKCLV